MAFDPTLYSEIAVFQPGEDYRAKNKTWLRCTIYTYGGGRQKVKLQRVGHSAKGEYTTDPRGMTEAEVAWWMMISDQVREVLARP